MTQVLTHAECAIENTDTRPRPARTSRAHAASPESVETLLKWRQKSAGWKSRAPEPPQFKRFDGDATLIVLQAREWLQRSGVSREGAGGGAVVVDLADVRRAVRARQEVELGAKVAKARRSIA